MKVHRNLLLNSSTSSVPLIKFTCFKHSVLWFSYESQASRGSVSEPQCDEYFSGSSSRGMTVYSAAFPFSLGLSLCRNVSISSSLCWFEEFVLVSNWDARFGPFHLGNKKRWEFNSVLIIVKNIVLFFRFFWVLLVSGSDGKAEHYQCCNTNNKPKDDDPTWRYGRGGVNKMDCLKTEFNNAEISFMKSIFFWTHLVYCVHCSDVMQEPLLRSVILE